MYLIVVQKSFNLIGILPDKVLRWIGGQPESIGQETMQWGDEAKAKVEKAGEATHQAVGQASKAGAGYVLNKLPTESPNVQATPGKE